MIRALAFGLAALLALTAQTAPTTPEAASVIAAASDRNAALQHFTFAVEAHIALLTFPWIRFTMHGHGTYTRHGEYTVHFDDVPWFGKSFDTMPMNALDLAEWPSLYTMSVAQQTDTQTVLLMHDVKKSPLVDARATIDDTQGLREILWTYDYGGHVKLTIVPQFVGGYYLPANEEAEIVMPHYRAMAWAIFSDYHVSTSPPASEGAIVSH
jgi:hypothetical protein